MINIYTASEEGTIWLERYKGKKPHLVCVLGFTATGLIPGISAAGATPSDRQYTAIADAEFLYKGINPQPSYPLPPLTAGISPVFITRGVIESLDIPLTLFNAGLPHPPNVPDCIDLGGCPAQCLSSGAALPLSTVEHLYHIGLMWGEKLAAEVGDSYLILGECVVGGTSTALALLMGLGIKASGMVNSSHPQCNHQQKLEIVQEGLYKAQDLLRSPLEVVAAVGDPMQIVVAGMAIGASPYCGVLLAGGTQMIAVYALIKSLVDRKTKLNNIVVGTTRWVAEDPTADTVGLARMFPGLPLLGTKLSFANSDYANLRLYEQGFVKEGVAAGGAAIAAHLMAQWDQLQLQSCIESLLRRYAQ